MKPPKNLEWDFEFEVEAEGQDEAHNSCLETLVTSAARSAVLDWDFRLEARELAEGSIVVPAGSYRRGPYVDSRGYYFDVHLSYRGKLVCVKVAVSNMENTEWYKVWEAQEEYWDELMKLYSTDDVDVTILSDRFPALTAQIVVTGEDGWTMQVRRDRDTVASVLAERLGSDERTSTRRRIRRATDGVREPAQQQASL